MNNSHNFYSDNEDIKFHLTRRVDMEEVFSLISAQAKEVSGCTRADEYWNMMDTMLESLGQLCAREIAPYAPEVEKEPIYLKDGDVILPPRIKVHLRKLLEMGCASLGISPEFGGLGIPFFLETTAHELIMRSCPSTGLNVVWYSSIAHVLDHYADSTIKAEVIPKIASGEWSGSMALTEPDAGSDLAALKTYGVQDSDGTWRLYGTKRFISNGASQVCLVLAMSAKGAKGLNNLSLFMCIREIDGNKNYKVTKLEEKIGLHGSATCELLFEGSKAVLVGELNQGFHYMLKLMNDARIAVGLQGVGHMEAILRLTKQYCVERQSWDKPLYHHHLVAEKLLDMEIDLKASRSLSYQAAYLQSLCYLYEARLKEKNQLTQESKSKLVKKLQKSRSRVRRLTPLIKWYVAERCVEMARTSLQLHGGYGFTKEYRPEFWLRESLILPLYEGTSQIQALMCVKDTLKEVIRRPRRFVENALGLGLKSLSLQSSMQSKLAKIRQIEQAGILALLLKVMKRNTRTSTRDLKATDLPKLIRSLVKDFLKMEDVTPAMLHAERICEMAALTELSASLVEDAEVDKARIPAAMRFMERSLIRLKMLKSEIEGDDSQIDSFIKALNDEVLAQDGSRELKKSS